VWLGGLRSSDVVWLASSCDDFAFGVLVFDEGDSTSKKNHGEKGGGALTVPLLQLWLSEQLRRLGTRLRPGWSHFDIQRRLLRKEQAYFYHHYSQNILPLRRYNRRL
jgi:hypothetical protein